ERNKPQRTLEAEPEEAREESEQTREESEQAYLDELLVPEPWELNNTARAGTDILFFNRVPKVGSQTFMELLRRLAIKNQFGFHRDAVQRVETIRLAPADQQVLVSLVSQHTPPASYIKHVCYTNFTRSDFETCVLSGDRECRYIEGETHEGIGDHRRQSLFFCGHEPNCTGDRECRYIEGETHEGIGDHRRQSLFFCGHEPNCTGDCECRYIEGETHAGIGDHRRQSLFFCGHEPNCTPFNSVETLQRAKRVVEEQYAVVGVLEDMNSTLMALERYPPVSEAVKNIVRANFTREIEFYEFCRQRLHMQLRALRDPTIALPTPRSVRRRRAQKRFGRSYK
ncbi:Pipe, partial [Operophtera brumata]